MRGEYMKVAFVTINCDPATLTGSDELVRVNAKYLVALGHDVYILASNHNDGVPLNLALNEKTIDGVKILRFWMFRLAKHIMLMNLLLPFFFGGKSIAGNPLVSKNTTLPIPPTLLKRIIFYFVVRCMAWLISPSLFFHLLRSDYDIVHVTAFPQTHIWLTVYAARLAGIPVVFTPAYHIETQSNMAWQLEYLARSATKLVVNTEKERIDLEALGIPKKKIIVNPPGIEPIGLDQCSGIRFRNKYGLGKAPIILFAGYKTFDKGFHHLVDAIEKVAQVIPEAIFVSIGRGSETLHSLTSQKLPTSINLGYVPVEEKRDAFAACDIYVMPSRCDSFGIVYAEAWMQKKPVIGARCGSIPWIIHDGVDGELVTFGDVDELAQKILHLLQSPSRRMGLGIAGYNYVNCNYLAPIVAQRLANIYLSLLSV
jgi:glycosyltransferase involved in cell wall biosynthesis